MDDRNLGKSIHCTGKLQWLAQKESCFLDWCHPGQPGHLQNLFFWCVIYMDGFIMVLFPDTYRHGEMMNILDIFWTTCNHSTVWFTFCLSIFYLLKIASISHPVFLWLKLKMNRVSLGFFWCPFSSPQLLVLYWIMIHFMTSESIMKQTLRRNSK